MEFREGDYIETKEGLFFHVKGILHPDDRVIAFLRYVPSDMGSRKKGENNYRKIYPINERYKYLEDNYPKYIFYSEINKKKIQSVPINDIKKIYRPQERLKEIRERDNLTDIEKLTLELSEKIIEESGIDRDRLGVSGSILVKLQKPGSDIDLMGYGKDEGWKIRSAMENLRERYPRVCAYDWEGSLEMAEFRWGKTGLPLEPFARIEGEKALHGLIGGRDFFIRLVKDPIDIDAKYGEFSYSPVGEAKIRGVVSGDKDSIFTPNHYEVEKTRTIEGDSFRVEKLSSYRGRFTEQAVEGDEIVARGRVERVSRKKEKCYRMILGRPEDYLLPIRSGLKPSERFEIFKG